jgi:hypothetical protein
MAICLKSAHHIGMSKNMNIAVRKDAGLWI